MLLVRFVFYWFLIYLLAGCDENSPDISYRREDTKKYDCTYLTPLFTKLDEPKPGEWLAEHEEHFESFEEYCDKDPRRPGTIRKVIYILPLGDFDVKNLSVINDVAEFFRSFFGLEVRIQKPVSADDIPETSKRNFNNHTQLHTQYILHHILAPSMPFDAVAYIAFSNYDLYPDPTWNFVFGQASVKKGVGVWSYYHYGGPDLPDHEKLEFLKRVLRTAGHETGHMFSLLHCVSYSCIMNGSNSLYEADHKPLYLCPDCLKKLCWNLGMDPKDHLSRMEKFWHQHKIFSISRFYASCLKMND